jgi:hypothetical protein
MENSDKKKKNGDEGIRWLTRPMYNCMVISLAILCGVGDRNLDHQIAVPILHAFLWIPLAIIVVANIIRFFELFKKARKIMAEPKTVDEIPTEE